MIYHGILKKKVKIKFSSDGVTGCGLYLALSFLLERMAVERECDVCLAVKAIRRSRPDFVRSLVIYYIISYHIKDHIKLYLYLYENFFYMKL